MNMKKEIPFIAFGNDELEGKQELGKTAKCPHCKKMHKVEFGTSEGKESKLLGFVSCGKQMFLVGLAGKLL